MSRWIFFTIAGILLAYKLWLLLLIYGAVLAFLGFGGVSMNPLGVALFRPHHILRVEDPVRFTKFSRRSGVLLLALGILCMIIGGLGYRESRNSAKKAIESQPETISNRAAIITVCDSGCDYTNVQTAVAAVYSGGLINIGTGTYLENVKIDKDLTLKGAGAEHTIIDGSGGGSVFEIARGVKVTLSGLTIRNGYSRAYGGGINNKGGTLVLSESLITSNTANSGGGIANSGGTVSITNSIIAANTAKVGAGITTVGGEVAITNSTVTDGITRVGGKITIANSDVTGNNNFGGTARMTITNSNVSGVNKE